VPVSGPGARKPEALARSEAAKLPRFAERSEGNEPGRNRIFNQQIKNLWKSQTTSSQVVIFGTKTCHEVTGRNAHSSLVFCAPPMNAKASVRLTGTSASPIFSVVTHVVSRMARIFRAILSTASSHVRTSMSTRPLTAHRARRPRV
jgi:hypothetical protein